MSKITFQKSWVLDFPWVKEGSRKGFATCILCNKDNIYYASMGRSSLTSHAKGQKHLSREKNATTTVQIKSLFKPPSLVASDNSNLALPSTSSDHNLPSSSNTSTEDPIVCNSPSTSTDTFHHGLLPSTDQLTSSLISGPSNLSKKTESAFVLKTKNWWKVKDEVTESEILWCLQTVMCRNSLRSAESSAHLFKRMFKDSSISNEMKLGKDKISYMITYGVAPYLKHKLLSLINQAEYFVLCFDESLNKFAQKQQMDIVIRYFNNTSMKVESNYFDSIFLYKTTSLDLLNGLKEGLSGLDIKKVLQLSMDGPNVNLKLSKMLKAELSETTKRDLLDLGTCSLHVLNVAFKTGFKTTSWNVMTFFRVIYYLFKDSPSRRGTFITATGFSSFPIKFCQVRWLENSAVAKRALEIFDSLKKFEDFVKTNKIKSILTASSFKTLCSSMEDKVLRPKIAFFESVAEDLESFLREFQTDSPVTPFLHSSLISVLKKLMGRIVKDEVMLSTPLQSIELTESNLKTASDIDLGYSTRAAIRKCQGIKDVDILYFRRDCKACIKKIIEKIMEKCPLKYPLTEALTFLNPHKVAFALDNAISQMTAGMDMLVSANIVQASNVQKADRQFRDLISKEANQLVLKNYSRDQRLDDFWMSLLSNEKEEVKELKSVISIFLSLSHGNATVERGFSVNGDLIIENLREESLSAQRLIYDNLKSSGGLQEFTITKELLLYVRNSNSRWKEALANKKMKMTTEEKVKAEKRKALAMAKELEESKKKILLQSEQAVAEIDEKIKGLKNM